MNFYIQTFKNYFLNMSNIEPEETMMDIKKYLIYKYFGKYH